MTRHDLMTGETLFAAIGSPHGDDAIAWAMADAIRGQCPQGVRILKLAVPSDLLDQPPGFTRLILCDACRGSGEPGTVTLWNWPNVPAFSSHRPGSHSFGALEVLKLCETLGRLPAVVQILGIEVSESRPGGSLSPWVQEQWPSMLRTVRTMIEAPPG